MHIQAYKEAEYLQKEMLQKLNPSTISKELKKNSSKVYKRYNAKKADIENKLNNRPRESLNQKTPNEVFNTEKIVA